MMSDIVDLPTECRVTDAANDCPHNFSGKPMSKSILIAANPEAYCKR